MRMVFEHLADLSFHWATIESTAPKIAWTRKTLLNWVHRADFEIASYAFHICQQVHKERIATKRGRITHQ
jgi:hypothetical protein